MYFAHFNDEYSVYSKHRTRYQAMGKQDLFWIALNILIVSILLLGLLRREKYGIANIGFESFLIILIYPLSIYMLL